MISSRKSVFSPLTKSGSKSITKTPASILKKRVLVDRHIIVTPKSKKQLQFSLAQSPDSSLSCKASKIPTPGEGIDEDNFLSQLVQFRQQNEELCYDRNTRRSVKRSNGQPEKRSPRRSTRLRRTVSEKLTPSKIGTSPGPCEPGQHACIHNYRLNSRLFAEPIVADERGQSLCPICQHAEPSDPSQRSPHFVRVSIPPGVVKSPIRVRPHRKKSFDPSDSLALSKHCLAGYVPPKNDLASTMMPSQKDFDLMSSAFGTKCHVTVTTRELQKMAMRDQQIGEQRSLTLGKRAAFNQSLSTMKRLQPGQTGFSNATKSINSKQKLTNWRL